MVIEHKITMVIESIMVIEFIMFTECMLFMCDADGVGA